MTSSNDKSYPQVPDLRTDFPTADESAALLTEQLTSRRPFFYVRYGDGAIECMWKPGSRHTCDGEMYSPDLAAALGDAWGDLIAEALAGATVFAGDWQSASFGNGSGHNPELDHWKKLIAGAPFRWLHFEALLLMRESQALVDFYKAVRWDRRRKVYMGPIKNSGAARFLRANHMVTPMAPDLIAQREKLGAQLDAYEAEVVLYGAGMAGNVVAVDAWKRNTDRTYISLGSALDPLFSGRSRSQQLPAHVLRQMFRRNGLL